MWALLTHLLLLGKLPFPIPCVSSRVVGHGRFFAFPPRNLLSDGLPCTLILDQETLQKENQTVLVANSGKRVEGDIARLAWASGQTFVRLNTEGRTTLRGNDELWLSTAPKRADEATSQEGGWLRTERECLESGRPGER